MLWLLRQFLHLRKALTSGESPREFAFGFAFGMMLGLLPKGNLLAVLLSMLIFASRVHLSVAMLSALAFSGVGALCDPLTHRLGLALLTWDVLRPTWTSLYNTPLVPWTAFNNTIVLGSLMLGVLLFYPAYYLAWTFCDRRRARKAARTASSPEPSVVKEDPLLAASGPTV